MLAARRHTTSAPLLLRRLSAQPKSKAQPPPPLLTASDEGVGAWTRREAALSLLVLTGAVAASAARDLSVFLSCSRRAMEKATQNQHIVTAIGEPITRGPWYSASIAVNHARHSVSCTLPVLGPQGDGLLKFKAVRLGDESWFSFLKHSDWEILIMDAILDVPTKDGKHRTDADWEILIMDAILDVPTKDGKHRTIRVTVPDNKAAPPPADCRACKSQATPTPTPPPSQEK